MIYISVGVFIAGLALGYIIAEMFDNINSAFKRHEAYLEETRKALEEIMINSGLAEQALEKKQEEDK